MRAKEHLQQKFVLDENIKEFLIYFRRFRNLSLKEIGQGTGYEATTLSKVFNGHQSPGEKFLQRLENFYLSDVLKQIQDLERRR